MARDWLIKSDFVNRRGLWTPWTIELSQEAEADILLACWAAHDFYKAEISGLGRVETRDNGAFFIPEVIIPRQICNIAGTTILGDVMDEVFRELEAAGKNPSDYYLWWHSHERGPARFSTIDDEMIEQRLLVMMTSVHARYLAQGLEVPDETLVGPFFSLVGNVFRQMTARCDFLYRCNDDYRYCAFTIPVIRNLAKLPEAEQKNLLMSRVSVIKAFVLERVRRVPNPLDEDKNDKGFSV